MDKVGAMGFLAFLGIILLVAGGFFYSEVESKRAGKILVLIGAVHMLPIFFYMWFKVIL